MLCCYFYFIFLSLYDRKKKFRKGYIKKNEHENNTPNISSIKYIHNNGKIAYLSNNTLLYFLFIIFLWILDENLIQLFSFLKDLDFLYDFNNV